jgi:ligand-binding SRPBCC domain-containing protein
MRFHFEHLVDLPQEEIFAFHADPANLVLLLSDWPGFRLLHHDGHILPGAATYFELTLYRILPVVFGFHHHIYEPPRRFGEVRLHGPFSVFTHIHTFDETSDGLLAQDDLTMQLPWYYGGEIVMRLIVAPIITQVFTLRQQALPSILAQIKAAQEQDKIS